MKLYVIGMGAGNEGGMTLDARAAIEGSELIFGYTAYISVIGNMFPDK